MKSKSQLKRECTLDPLQAADKIHKLESRLEKAIKTLELYATGSWQGVTHMKFVMDQGDLARQTLQEIKSEC